MVLLAMHRCKHILSILKKGHYFSWQINHFACLIPCIHAGLQLRTLNQLDSRNCKHLPYYLSQIPCLHLYRKRACELGSGFALQCWASFIDARMTKAAKETMVSSYIHTGKCVTYISNIVPLIPMMKKRRSHFP